MGARKEAMQEELKVFMLFFAVVAVVSAVVDRIIHNRRVKKGKNFLAREKMLLAFSQLSAKDLIPVLEELGWVRRLPQADFRLPSAGFACPELVGKTFGALFQCLTYLGTEFEQNLSWLARQLVDEYKKEEVNEFVRGMEQNYPVWADSVRKAVESVRAELERERGETERNEVILAGMRAAGIKNPFLREGDSVGF
jgi:hypothetical protein